MVFAVAALSRSFLKAPQAFENSLQKPSQRQNMSKIKPTIDT